MALVRLLLRASWLALRCLFYVLRFVVRLAFRQRKQRGLGSARFATSFEMFLAGVRRGNGPIVGRSGVNFLRFNKDGMITVFAPMGAGKGVGIVIPNLLTYPGSIVCTDIKGENFAITARHRRTRGEVRVLNTADPYASDCFNPIDMVRCGTLHEKDDAEALANLMIAPDGHEGHWDRKAEGLLAALILHTLSLEEPLRSLSQVRSLSTLPPESLKALLRTISETGSSAAAELASSFLSMEGSEEFKSVYSNAEKATRVWSAGSPAGAISAQSTFRLSDLIDSTLTLYLIVDEEKLAVYGGFLRVMTGCTITALTRAKGTRRPKHKVLLLLDEAAALGRLEPLERGVGYLRAYCTPLLVFQDMNQLREIYRRSGSFLANAACKVFFNVADLEGARFVSEMIGATTSLSRNDGISQSSDDLLRMQHSAGRSETGRPLLDPSEVIRLPGHRSLVIYRSDILQFPVLANKLNYRQWRHWHWWGTFDHWPPITTTDDDPSAERPHGPA